MNIGSSTDDLEDDKLNADQNQDSDNGASGVNGADSSNAQDENKPADVEEAVRRALGEGRQEQSSSSGENGNGGQPTDPAKPAGEAAGGADEGELTEAELNSLKPRTRRSFERMRGQIGELEQQLSTYQKDAQTTANIRSFCHEHDLSSEDVNAGFEIMKFMKTDPARAFELLTPVYQTLMELVGEVLPDDLQQQVVDGQITAERAQEISRLRARTSLTEVNGRRAEEKRTTQQQQSAVADMAKATGDAVSQLEKQWMASDPDYRVKSARIMERIELDILKAMRSKDQPRTKEAIIAIVQNAKKVVDEDYKRFLPKKPQIQTVTGVGASTGSKPAPKSTKEAIMQALGH